MSRIFLIILSCIIATVLTFHTILAAPSPSIQPSPTLSNVKSFQTKRVWVHHLTTLPDFNLDPPEPPFGALYPLELMSSYTTPLRDIDLIQRMKDSGINGVQALIYGYLDESANVDELLQEADRHPGFVVAPSIYADTEDQAVNLVQTYAALAARHTSAAKENGKLVIFTYGSRYGHSPNFWQNVRNRLSSAGIATFFVNDIGADLSVNGGLQSNLVTPYFPVFDASYTFEDTLPEYWSDVVSLFNRYNRAYAGGIMPGYDRETSADGGYRDAEGTARYRKQWDLGLAAGLQWQTVNTWNDTVEHSEIQPTSDWNWTRADITAFYSAKLRGTPYRSSSPQLYVTTAKMIHLRGVPKAEGLILNPGNSPMTVQIQLVDSNQTPYSNTFSVVVGPYSAGAVTIPSNLTVNSFPAGRFLRARAKMYNSAGAIVQEVTSAPILIYSATQVPELDGRTLYYSIPAAKALPGSVGLKLNGSPVASPGTATATVIPPSGNIVRFAEVLQNTRQVKNMFAQTPFTTRVPLTNGEAIVGDQVISTSASGFYMARVIDEQERVGYSDPVYIP
jgi:hypothetical protein